MPGIKLIAFDLLDTVVVDPFFTEIPKVLHRPTEEVYQLLRPDNWLDFECGRIDEATYLSRIYSRDDPRLPRAAALRRAIVENYRFVPEMEALLDELRKAKYTLWVLSNYSCWAVIIRQRLRLDRIFAGFTVSYLTGKRKPDRAAYQALAAATGVPLDQSLLIDDRELNVTGAASLGMHALHFAGVTALREQLAGLGLLATPALR